MKLVILLHGIGQKQYVFKKLSNTLEENDYDILNIKYPSTKMSIEGITEFIHKEIKPVTNKYEEVNFVGFSLGGLIIRAYLNKYKLENLGKVIFMGTPHAGSEIADLLKNIKIFKNIFGPAGQQLVTNNNQLANILGTPYYEFATIAGNLSLDIWFLLFLTKANDGKVSVRSAKLEGAKDHITLKVSHWQMPKSKRVCRQVVYFLENSTFKH